LNTSTSSRPEPLSIGAPVSADNQPILPSEALEFIAALNERFGPRVTALLKAREARQKRIDAGELPDFLPETKSVRESAWTVAPIPRDLLDRRVEITGPTDRKMIINALNSGAKVFMADCEDSLSPTWENVVAGQTNLRDAVRRTIELVNEQGKVYRLNSQTAVLIVRPRGWHLYEKHITQQGSAGPNGQVSGAFVDFGLYFFHNAKEALARGTGPYFYLPKLESHLEARLWAEVFAFSEERLGVPHGSIKVTVLIETILAAFEMDEILFELKDYIVGLNCGRWDYIFSFIKKFAKRPDFVLPDRALVTMTTHFLRSYSLLCIQTCHKRGAFAMGGMAPQIPIKNDPKANEIALGKVRADKEREATDGHDGTWVAHPGLVPIAREIFDKHMQSPNQLRKLRKDVNVVGKDLLVIPEGSITFEGLRMNVSVSLQYMAAWLAGNGCVPINNLMEDAATAEISRAQIWQWIRHPRGVLDDGRKVTAELFRSMLEAERVKMNGPGNPYSGTAYYDNAAEVLDEITTAPEFVTFLTLAAYRKLG
jgi:malate synthase